MFSAIVDALNTTILKGSIDINIHAYSEETGRVFKLRFNFHLLVPFT